MIKKLQYLLWNVCDYQAGNDTPGGKALFVACAWLLDAMGCDYWKKSADYKYFLKGWQ